MMGGNWCLKNISLSNCTMKTKMNLQFIYIKFLPDRERGVFTVQASHLILYKETTIFDFRNQEQVSNA